MTVHFRTTGDEHNVCKTCKIISYDLAFFSFYIDRPITGLYINLLTTKLFKMKTKLLSAVLVSAALLTGTLAFSRNAKTHQDLH